MRLCVYTAVFGRYDRLLEQPIAGDSEADFICFTDDANLTSDSWEVRIVKPAFLADTVRSARLIKILGDDSLEDYDVSLYIDASVRLRVTPEEVVRSWLPAYADMALAAHSYREHLVDEFDEVVRLNYDDQSRVYEQLADYASAHPEALDGQPLWTGIIVRRIGDATRVAMRTWANHVMRYSRRDQLSIQVALDSSPLAVNVIEVDNFSSDLHEWPVIEGRRIAMGKAPAVRPGPLLAELRRAQSEIAHLKSERDAGEARHLEELTRSASRLDHAESARAELDHRTRAAEARVTELEASIRHLRNLRPAAGNFRRALVRRIMRR